MVNSSQEEKGLSLWPLRTTTRCARLKALCRHVDRKTLQQVIDDLLDVPGNKSFRERIETLAHELLKPWEPCDASVKWAEA
jgi:hypothetical protein